jgi:hypothetical protein
VDSGEAGAGCPSSPLVGFFFCFRRCAYPCNPRPAAPSVAAATEGWFFKRFPNFPRNLAPDFTHYLSERPEMTSPWHAGASAKAARRGLKEGQNNSEQLKERDNTYEDKINESHR